jgi:polar amino acid transport system permease protein
LGCRLSVSLEKMPVAHCGFCPEFCAYFAEIFPRGNPSIDRGQYESADVLGLSYTATP